MHDQHSSGCPTAARRGDRDPQVAYEEQQALVLDDLLSEHPGLMTFEEARLARVRDPRDRGESDAFEIAVRGLGWAGLIRRQGDLLVPGQARATDGGPRFPARLMDSAKQVAGIVGPRIRRIRRGLDMSQEALAENAEMYRTEMTGIEWGERLPRLDTLIKLAGGLVR